MAELKTLHVAMNLRVNLDGRYAYQEPIADKEINFSIPVELFNAQSVTKLIEKIVNEVSKEFDEKQKEYLESLKEE